MDAVVLETRPACVLVVSFCALDASSAGTRRRLANAGGSAGVREWGCRHDAHRWTERVHAAAHEPEEDDKADGRVIACSPGVVGSNVDRRVGALCADEDDEEDTEEDAEEDAEEGAEEDNEEDEKVVQRGRCSVPAWDLLVIVC